MSRSKPTYFLTPPRPYPPNGPIRLGAIIPSPTLPDEPIYLPKASPSNVSSFAESKWSGSHVKKNVSRFGVWASFLQMIVGVGGDIEIERKQTLSQSWTVDKMSTQSFIPDLEFMEGAVASEEVRDYVVGNRFREKIYMITGVMVASGTSLISEKLKEKGLYITAGVDATSWTGVPVNAGPQGGFAKLEGLKTSSTREDDFVFAFRIRQIKVKRKGGIKSHRVHTDGALFSTDQPKKGKIEEDDVELDSLEDEAGGEEFGLEEEEIEQVRNKGGDIDDCFCVLPEA